MSKTIVGGNFYFLRGFGVLILLIAIVIPPEWLVGMVLPARGAVYNNRLVMGMWCLKGALVLNGLLAIFFPTLKRWLWGSITFPYQTMRTFFQQADSDRLQRWEWLIFVAVLIFAFVLRLIGANASYWGDELAVQQMVVSRGLPTIVSYWPSTTHHIGYEILAWFSLKLPLSAELASRLPAIIFGTASVATTYWLARRAGLPALVVAFLQAISVYSIIYSQMLKGYTANLFFFTVAVIGICLMQDKGLRARGWVLFGAALVAMVYTHLHAIFSAAGLVLAASLVLWNVGESSTRKAMMKRLALTLGIVGCLIVLLYSLVMPQILNMASGTKSLSEEGMSADFFRGWLMQLTFWGRAWPVALASGVLAAIGLVSLARREPRLTGVLVFPVVVVLGLTGVLGVFIYPRYMVFALPLFLMACAEGAIVLLRNRIVAMSVLIAAFTIPSAQALKEYYQVGFQNIRGAMNVAESHARLDDVIVGYGLARPVFRYYSERIQPVSTVSELDAFVRTSKNDVYLVYAWRNAWKARKSEFDWIHERFDVVERFDGMLMDSCVRDGEVVVLKHRKTQDKTF